MNLPIYERYTKSNILWVGNYPSEWFITKVKYEAYVKARVGWHGLKSDDFTDEGPFLVTGSDFKSSRIQWADCYHCDLNRYEQDPYIQLRNGDLLITKDGTIGKVALVDGLKTNDKATLNSGVFVVRPLINNFSTRFYFWLLQSKVFTDFVDYNKTGSTIVHLYQDTFVNFSYASPQLKEQLQIAAFLDHETTKIDNLIAKQQQLIELLKEKRQAVISHAVTKGLNPDVPMKDSGVEWLGEMPEHWKIIKFSHCVSIRSGQVDPRKLPYCDYWLIAPNHIVSGEGRIINLETAKDQGADSGKYLCRTGEVIYSKIRPALVKACLSPSDTVLCSADMYPMSSYNGLTNNFLLLYLLSDVFTRFAVNQADRVAMPKINRESLSDCKIPVPPIDEQEKIYSHVREALEKLDVLLQKSQLTIEFFQERRTALISATVTGKIDVRDWVAPDTQDIGEPQEATA